MLSHRVELAHGGGGTASWQLIKDVFASRFCPLGLQLVADAALVSLPNPNLVITTDAFVAQPLFFPGGNLGTLAVNGSCNDVAVMGGRPRWLTCAFIISSGTPMKLLEELADAMAVEAQSNQVQIATGDTKVVEGTADKPEIYIVSTGIGTLEIQPAWQPSQVRPNDVLVITGPVGDHTIALLSARYGWNNNPVKSDCTCLYPLLQRLHCLSGVHFARDVTRGGLSGVCHELAQSTRLSIELDEASIPIHPYVAGRCELLGHDPLTLANEGNALLAVTPEIADRVIATLRSHPLGTQATVIGRVLPATATPIVTLHTVLGGVRLLPPPTGTLFPRIC